MCVYRKKKWIITLFGQHADLSNIPAYGNAHKIF